MWRAAKMTVGLNIYKDKKWIHVRFKDKYQFDDLFSDIIELNDGKICIGGIGRIFIGEMLDWKRKPESSFCIK